MLISASVKAQETPAHCKVLTIVESIVPAGIGRSRMIESNPDHKTVEGDRRDLKTDAYSETKLLNLYSLTGINFQNIASNDAMIASRISELSNNGWKLAFVSTGVESKGGAGDGEGIFITRLIFYH